MPINRSQLALSTASTIPSVAWANGYENAINNLKTDSLDRTGDSMTGLLTLSGLPTNINHAANKQYVDDSLDVLIGTVLSFMGTNPPPKFLLPVGQAVSRTTYSALFSKIGTTYGVGNGSTTFNLPDYRGRTDIGLDNMGGTSANRVTSNASILGANGGAETHALTASENGPHNHAITDPGHNHSAVYRMLYWYGGGQIGTVFQVPQDFGRLMAFDTGQGGAVTSDPATQNRLAGLSIQTSGSGSPHNNMQPYIAVNKVIYVGV